MHRLELLNVEYGDCTVLVGKGPSAFMVDCGSMNQKLRKPEMDMARVVGFIQARYSAMAQRQFLLTHYHRDHLWGFQQIVKSQPNYFNKIYLPFLPLDGQGGSPLLELALFAHVFAVPQSTRFQVNTACLGAFVWLGKAVGQQRLFAVQAGDQFVFDGTSYGVLHPPEKDFSFSKAFLQAVALLNQYLAQAQGQWAVDFLQAKQGFVASYHHCLRAFALKQPQGENVRTRALQRLEAALLQVEALRAQAGLCAAVSSIGAVLAGQALGEAYSAAVNDCSVVFHNRRTVSCSTQDILMTGDIGAQQFAALAPSLYPEYYIVKAPHHGTQSGYSPLLAGLNPVHVLISSGDYHAGSQLAPAYHNLQAMKHCTNRIKCGYYKAQKQCCSRLCRCGSLPGGLFALKCPAVKINGSPRSCGIYVVSPGVNPLEFAPKGSLACLCDMRG